jgi:hypothetical protein
VAHAPPMVVQLLAATPSVDITHSCLVQRGVVALVVAADIKKESAGLALPWCFLSQATRSVW